MSGETVWVRQETPAHRQEWNGALCSLPRAELTIRLGDYLYIEAFVNGQKLPRALYFPDGWRDIPWPQPHITLRGRRARARVADRWLTRLRVQTDVFARLAHLLYRGSEGSPAFSDNYFDLSAGR